jgi:choline dehydrogenase-like flavoprotein
MGWFHGQPADYERWVAAGATGWGWQDVLPVLPSIEDHELGASEYHGSGGPSGVQCLRRLRAGDPGRVRRLAEISRPGTLGRRREPVQLAGHPVIVGHGPDDSGVPPGWSPAWPGVISVGSGARPARPASAFA